MNRFFAFFMSISLAASVAPVFAEPPVDEKKSKAVQADVKEIIDAVYDADVDVILEHTHPVIIDSMGGKEKAEEFLETSLKKTKADGLKVEDFSFPADPIFVEGKENEYVIVPTKLAIVMGKEKIESVNFQFGTRKAGDEKWVYLEGSRINSQVLSKLFPDFPPDYKFPEISRKKFGPED